ncbi:translin-associated factor X-interacting protein 1 [Symphorus nematophorus]
MHLESYVNKELQSINSHEPKFQELKLQVYRDAFGNFIKEFKTYQPLLSAIKKEYETALAYQRDQIQELEPLRSRLRLVTEECDRRIQARRAEEQAEIAALKREKQQLQKDIEAMREREKATQAALEHLQSELSNQYLQYREERDARKLLIWQLSDLTRGSVREEHPADENTGGAKDPVQLQLALKVCRADLTKAQEELNRMKAEYWDVVPRRNWDTLEQTHKQTLQQLKTLQGDFDQLKSEYDTLLELHKNMQNEERDAVTVQAGLTVLEKHGLQKEINEGAVDDKVTNHPR